MGQKRVGPITLQLAEKLLTSFDRVRATGELKALSVCMWAWSCLWFVPPTGDISLGVVRNILPHVSQTAPCTALVVPLVSLSLVSSAVGLQQTSLLSAPSCSMTC